VKRNATPLRRTRGRDGSAEEAVVTAVPATGKYRPEAVTGDRRLLGELMTIAAILETAVIERILDHLGLPAPARPPPRSPARAPMPHAA